MAEHRAGTAPRPARPQLSNAAGRQHHRQLRAGAALKVVAWQPPMRHGPPGTVQCATARDGSNSCRRAWAASTSRGHHGPRSRSGRTNPAELIAAAHPSCSSRALPRAGTPPETWRPPLKSRSRVASASRLFTSRCEGLFRDAQSMAFSDTRHRGVVLRRDDGEAVDGLDPIVERLRAGRHPSRPIPSPFSAFLEYR